MEDDSPATWRYDLIAPSADRLRAIVEHATVEDTHYIDRQQYTLAPDAQRTVRRGGLIAVGGAVAVGLVDRLAMFLAVLAGLCVLVRHPMRVARWLIPYLEIAGESPPTCGRFDRTPSGCHEGPRRHEAPGHRSLLRHSVRRSGRRVGNQPLALLPTASARRLRSFPPVFLQSSR